MQIFAITILVKFPQLTKEQNRKRGKFIERILFSGAGINR